MREAALERSLEHTAAAVARERALTEEQRTLTERAEKSAREWEQLAIDQSKKTREQAQRATIAE